MTTTKKPRKAKEKIYGNRIKIILSEIEMSQQELADLAFGGDKAYISRIINGKRRCISLPIAFKIANVLKRPIEEVFIYKHNEVTKKEN